MTRKSGFRTWPPLWPTTRLDPNDKPTGEIGILEKALMNELFDNKIFLFVQYQGFRYMAAHCILTTLDSAAQFLPC
jgi:hypothetical protein